MNSPNDAGTDAAGNEPAQFNQKLALLLAMAMFVLVVDTSIMNVSISAVVKDIDAPSATFSRPSPSKRWSPPHSS